MTSTEQLQRYSLVIALFLLVLVYPQAPLSAQKKPAVKKPTQAKVIDHSAAVMATVGSERVLYADVERAFQKNLTRRDTKLSSVPRDTAMEFLRLYTNYRLKVASAKERNMDKDSSVIADIANNKKLLSETYYFDKAFADARVNELARRRSKELKIGIILCAVSQPNARTWDSTASLRKAEAVIEMLNQGADFKKLASDTSDDKETASNGGQLPWISGGSIIKVVEDEAYMLPTGGHSTKPVPSKFGFFVVKLFEQDVRQVVRFRHILLQKKEGYDSVRCDRVADSLIAALNAAPAKQEPMLRALGVAPGTGDAFTRLAEKFSDDKNTSTKGGYMGAWYSRSGGTENNNSRLVPEFEAGVFSTPTGKVSGKVHTIFGVHIIIRDSTKFPDAFAERDNAKRTYRRLYFEDDKRALYDSLKKANGYKWVDEIYKKLMTTIDTTKNSQDTAWWRPIEELLMAQDLYLLPKRSITVKEFTDSLRRRADMRGYTLNSSGMDRAMNKIVDPMVLEQASADLDKKYPDFAALMQEFNDGILLFKVEEQEVWSKLKFDTADAKVFYDSTQSRWKTETKYELSEIYALTDSVAQEARTRINRGEDFGAVATALTQRDGGREKAGAVGVLSPKTSKLAQKAAESAMVVGGTVGPFPHEKGFSIIKLNRIESPRQKTFTEALPELAPAYQDALQKRLTEQWLGDVRKRFPVVVNNTTVDSIWGKKGTK